jgi:hypothetical protein
MYYAQMNRFHLRKEKESSIQNVVFQIKDWTMDIAQKCESCINISSSKSYRSYLLSYVLPNDVRISLPSVLSE